VKDIQKIIYKNMAHQSERDEVENKKFVDYKDVAYLRQFMNPHAKILAKKRSGVSSAKQRQIALAIKRARYMALLPYLAA
jgi:small subunit ribosomal protein S18